MMKVVRYILKIMIGSIILVVLFIAVFLLHNTLTDFQPQLIEKLKITDKESAPDTSIFSLLSRNIGYAGLGKEQDFFYDGGKGVMPVKYDYDRYEKGILDFIKQNNTIDFALFQEVDIDSKRSYHVNQFEKTKNILTGYAAVFAKNYDVTFVPFPLSSPMGKVVSGLATFSKHQAIEALRYDFVANFSWPKKIFMLDRCFLLMRFALKNGKDLVLINIHNSAFDDSFQLRAGELAQLKEKMIEEYQKGNYIIVGGDWNQNPLGFDEKNFTTSEAPRSIQPPMDEQFLSSGWQWVYDHTIPTNRDVDMPYKNRKTKTTIIDFFVVSPNVTVMSYKTISKEFLFSDHNPIYLKVKL